MGILIKRIYEKPDPKDGTRILVDRLWPRGLSKQKADIDVWLKTVAPSDALRQWYGHDVKKWPEFKQRYFLELDASAEAVEALLGYVKQGDAALLYAAKDTEHNNAVALKEYIDGYGIERS